MTIESPAGEPGITRGTIAGASVAVMLVLLAFAAGYRAVGHDIVPTSAASPAAATPSEVTTSTTAAHEGLLYGRVTTDDDGVYEGRLRWGGGEEALWGNYFNGFKKENPWLPYAPPEALKERTTISVFGIEIAGWERKIELGRPFMARFGDIARIDARGRELRVTLKSGTELELDRYSADDLADGVRVWDETRGVVDLGEWGIRSIELFPTARPGAAPRPLHGTVRTPGGDFTGFIQWDREDALGPDELEGHTESGELSLRFDDVRSIERRAPGGSLVRLVDGREFELSGSREVGEGNRGIYVDDPRYGRVLISWDAFERVDFSPGGTGPAYGDFAAGHPLTGTVITRSGRRLTGRLVYDLDESETTETLDAPSRGVDYTILFGLVASIVPPGLGQGEAQRARVTLHSGEEVQLEAEGDLGAGNAGVLVFVDGLQPAEYVTWADVARIEFDRPAAMVSGSGPGGA